MADAERGVLAYLGDGGSVRGREEWTLSVAPDGSRLLRSSCWMFDTQIERHVVHTVSAGFRPVRSFVSQRQRGEFLGEGWFVFSPRELEAQLVSPAGERQEQRQELQRPMPYFVPHVVAADSWILASYDCRAGGRQALPGGYASSLRADGSTSPRALELPELAAEMVGRETVDGPAGCYHTWHFVVQPYGGVEEHIWTTTDGNWTMVRLRSDRLATTYELVEHTASGWPPAPPARG